MIVSLDKLRDFLDDYFAVADCPDASNNGLQVEGAREVKKAVFGVDACHALFEAAVEKNADFIFVHHGISWKGGIKFIRGIEAMRLRTLLSNNISLYAAHLPLDKHAETGHNILLARALQLSDITPFFEYDGVSIGYSGSFPSPCPVNEFAETVEKIVGNKPLVFSEGKKSIETVGIVSGGAPEAIEEAARRQLDCLLTGEIGHSSYHWPAEYRMNVVAAGHYRTEVPGIKAVKELLEREFGLEGEFVDIPTFM
ncbi:MAG: Nif3-like dinuclear metal center hexameric protein [Verrucomicrobiota bacterium]